MRMNIYPEWDPFSFQRGNISPTDSLGRIDECLHRCDSFRWTSISFSGKRNAKLKLISHTRALLCALQKESKEVTTTIVKICDGSMALLTQIKWVSLWFVRFTTKLWFHNYHKNLLKSTWGVALKFSLRVYLALNWY